MMCNVRPGMYYVYPAAIVVQNFFMQIYFVQHVFITFEIYFQVVFSNMIRSAAFSNMRTHLLM